MAWFYVSSVNWNAVKHLLSSVLRDTVNRDDYQKLHGLYQHSHTWNLHKIILKKRKRISVPYLFFDANQSSNCDTEYIW